MLTKNQIATYYSNARELVKQGNPKAARAYVLLLLNAAVETRQSATTILIKAKTEAFLDKWIAVSRDLYDKGITDYVLECFGLSFRAEKKMPGEKAKQPEKVKTSPKEEPVVEDSSADYIDIAGLINETAKTQGWCAEVFEKNKDAVVEISVSAASKEASGTGFIISDNGYLLTNDHVVYDENNGAYYPKIKMTKFGDKKSHKIEVLFSDKTADIALCKFDPGAVSGFTCVKRIADYSSLMQGADCLVVGNAFGMGLAPFTGVIRFTKNHEGNLVYTAPSNPGDSGGPVFNRLGECIGINKSKTVAVNGATAEAYANATTMDKINELLTKWTKHNDIKL